MRGTLCRNYFIFDAVGPAIAPQGIGRIVAWQVAGRPPFPRLNPRVNRSPCERRILD
jgi:hypothetical protein